MNRAFKPGEGEQLSNIILNMRVTSYQLTKIYHDEKFIYSHYFNSRD